MTKSKLYGKDIITRQSFKIAATELGGHALFLEPSEEKLDTITVDQAQKYIDEGHFAPGSMLPKIEAVIQYIKNGEISTASGKKVIITSLSELSDCIEGLAGTTIE